MRGGAKIRAGAQGGHAQGGHAQGGPAQGGPAQGGAAQGGPVTAQVEGSSAADATGPREIPAEGWRQVLRRVGQHIGAEQLLVLSAGIAFFAVLSIAPVLVTALSVYGAVNTPAQAHQQLSEIAGALPPALEQVIADQLTSITAASTQVQTRRGLTGLLVALWTATTAATCLVDALTRAYSETETRSWLRRTGTGLSLVLGGALLVGALIAAAGVLSRSGAAGLGPSGTGGTVLIWLGAGAVLAVVMAAVLAVLYRFGPDRRQARWQWVTHGAALTTVLWLATSLGLFAYVQQLGTYETTYGSLAGVAISMFWLWLTVFLVLLGAVVNAETERQTLRDSTVGPERPLGERGAVVADTLPSGTQGTVG